MRRREFITALGLAAVSPLSVQAEQPKKVPRIGCIMTGSLELPETRANLNAFLQGLRRLPRLVTSHGGLAQSRPLASGMILAVIVGLILVLPQRPGRHPVSGVAAQVQ